MSVEQRQRAVTHLNPVLATLVEDEDVFADPGPVLFGKSFEKRAKDHIRQSDHSRKPPYLPQGADLFRGATPNVPGRWHLRGRRGPKKFETPQSGKRTQQPF